MCRVVRTPSSSVVCFVPRLPVPAPISETIHLSVLQETTPAHVPCHSPLSPAHLLILFTCLDRDSLEPSPELLSPVEEFSAIFLLECCYFHLFMLLHGY